MPSRAHRPNKAYDPQNPPKVSRNTKGVNQLLAEVNKKVSDMKETLARKNRLARKKEDPTARDRIALRKIVARSGVPRDPDRDPLDDFPVSADSFRWLLKLRGCEHLKTTEGWRQISAAWPDFYKAAVVRAREDAYQLTMNESQELLFSLYPMVRELAKVAGEISVSGVSKQGDRKPESKKIEPSPVNPATVLEPAPSPVPSKEEPVAEKNDKSSWRLSIFDPSKNAPPPAPTNDPALQCGHSGCKFEVVPHGWTLKVNDCGIPKKVGYCERHTRMRKALRGDKSTFWGTSEEADEYIAAAADSADLMPGFD